MDKLRGTCMNVCSRLSTTSFTHTVVVTTGFKATRPQKTVAPSNDWE